MNQFEPLSATNMPYFFSAVRMISAAPWYGARLNDAFSRNRAPIGGALDEVVEPAWWVAGWM